MAVLILRSTASGGGGGGDLVHGSSFSVSGSFAARGSPQALVWDNGTDAAEGSLSSQWSSGVPNAAGDSSYNIQNEDFPIALGTSGTINAPHSRTSRAPRGGHYGSSSVAGYDVMLNKTFTRPATTYYIYTSHYLRLGPNWRVDSGGDDNYKDWDLSIGSDAYDSGGQYWYTGSFLTSNTDSTIQQLQGQGTTAGTVLPDQNGHNAFWNSYTNPCTAWIKTEREMRGDTGIAGFNKERVNNGGTLILNYLGVTDDFSPGNTRTVSLGGYSRNYPTTLSTRVFADSFIQVFSDSPDRLMLANNATYASATIVEPQYITAQTSSSITYNCNLGALGGSGSTVYLFYGSWTNGWTSLGSKVVA